MYASCRFDMRCIRHQVEFRKVELRIRSISIRETVCTHYGPQYKYIGTTLVAIGIPHMHGIILGELHHKYGP